MDIWELEKKLESITLDDDDTIQPPPLPTNPPSDGGDFGLDIDIVPMGRPRYDVPW